MQQRFTDVVKLVRLLDPVRWIRRAPKRPKAALSFINRRAGALAAIQPGFVE